VKKPRLKLILVNQLTVKSKSSFCRVYNKVQYKSLRKTTHRKIRNKSCPWLNSDIKKLSYHRDYLKKQAVKLNSDIYHEAYKKCKNQVTKLIRSSKKHYYQTKLENSKNSKDSWKYINELLNRKPKRTAVNQLRVDEQTVTSNENIANEPNKFFREIGPKLAEKIPTNNVDHLQYITPCTSRFAFKQISVEDLTNVLNRMKTKKAEGPDKITNKLLKAAGYTIYESLLYIFNLVLVTGIFPDDLKQSRVTPIFKDGDKSECGNYRPISVISAIAKVLEMLISDQLAVYLNDNNIIVKQQSGFRKCHSTEIALLHITDQYLLNMDKGILNGVLILDLKKAFDTVDHQILISKLNIYGIGGVALNLFKSYISNREVIIQRCKIQGIDSQPNVITCGVPQGSNLGPLLFSVYINDIPNCLEETQASMFADDTSISSSGTSLLEIENKINNDLHNVYIWLETNNLTLNTEKTEFML
jgi:hypothetical protein